MKATFELEAIELELSGGPIAGVDESGRGPLAGPVVAAAVVLDPAFIPDGIADCKALDAKARQSVYQAILATAQVGIGVASVGRIDTDNILNAALWAMAQAVARLADRPRLVLARDYPHYGFDRHKGYGTREHHAAIARYGVTPHHRRSFRPVQLALGLV